MNLYQRIAPSVVSFVRLPTMNFVGTGFLVADAKRAVVPGNSVFRVVTNRHIAQLPNLGLCTNAVPGVVKSARIVDSIDNNRFTWKFHDRKSVDVASMVIGPGRDISTGKLIQKIAWVPDQNFAPPGQLDEGDEVIFLGFPRGLGTDSPRQRPVLRRGIVALKSHGQFLIDGHSFPGNSGSPVFLIRKYGGRALSHPRLVGIVAGTHTYADVCVSRQTGKPRITFEENMGLAVAFNTSSILATFKAVPRK